MTVMNLEDPEVMKQVVAAGAIWSAPVGAIRKACEGIADGSIPAPSYIPPAWSGYLASLGWHRPTTAPDELTTGIGNT